MPDSQRPTFRQLERENRKLLRNIRNHAFNRHNPIGRSAFQSACNRFLTSKAARTLALAEARKVRANERDVQTIYGRLNTIRCWQDVILDGSRRVDWHYKTKRSGGFRRVCSLSNDLAMWNYLARQIILQVYQPRQHVAHWPGRGRDRQIRAMRASCLSREIFAVLTDVRSAYQHVDPDALYQLLDLPGALIRGALDARFNTYRYVGGRSLKGAIGMSNVSLGSTNTEPAPQGLLQGSPTSDLVFGLLMDDLPDHIPSNLGCFGYSDNVGVLSWSEQDALAVRANLVEYFSRHPAGPFVLRTEVVPLSGMGFDYLGYWFRWNGDRLSVRMSTGNEHRFMRSLECPDEFNLSGFQYVRRSFSACTDDALDDYANRASDATVRRLLRANRAPASQAA